MYLQLQNYLQLQFQLHVGVELVTDENSASRSFGIMISCAHCCANFKPRIVGVPMDHVCAPPNYDLPLVRLQARSLQPCQRDRMWQRERNSRTTACYVQGTPCSRHTVYAVQLQTLGSWRSRTVRQRGTSHDALVGFTACKVFSVGGNERGVVGGIARLQKGGPSTGPRSATPSAWRTSGVQNQRSHRLL